MEEISSKHQHEGSTIVADIMPKSSLHMTVDKTGQSRQREQEESVSLLQRGQ